MKRPFLLFKRGRYWYYRLPREKTFHTTEQKTLSKAEAFVVDHLRNAEGQGRLREEGKSITCRHAKIQHQRLEKHILSDSFEKANGSPRLPVPT